MFELLIDPLLLGFSDDDKRGIWQTEAIILFVAALIMAWQHHIPYILMTLSTATLLYSVLLGRVDFRYVLISDPAALVRITCITLKFIKMVFCILYLCKICFEPMITTAVEPGTCCVKGHIIHR